jgi:hypothetical protein
MSKMLWTHSKNKDRTLQKVLNIKLKEYTQEKDQDQDGNIRLGKMSHRTKKEHGKKLRCSSGMKEWSIKKFGCYMTHTKWRCLKKVISRYCITCSHLALNYRTG